MSDSNSSIKLEVMKARVKIVLIAVVVLLALALTACTSSSNRPDDVDKDLWKSGYTTYKVLSNAIDVGEAEPFNLISRKDENVVINFTNKFVAKTNSPRTESEKTIVKLTSDALHNYRYVIHSIRVDKDVLLARLKAQGFVQSLKRIYVDGDVH